MVTGMFKYRFFLAPKLGSENYLRISQFPGLEIALADCALFQLHHSRLNLMTFKIRLINPGKCPIRLKLLFPTPKSWHYSTFIRQTIFHSRKILHCRQSYSTTSLFLHQSAHPQPMSDNRIDTTPVYCSSFRVFQPAVKITTSAIFHWNFSFSPSCAIYARAPRSYVLCFAAQCECTDECGDGGKTSF